MYFFEVIIHKSFNFFLIIIIIGDYQMPSLNKRDFSAFSPIDLDISNADLTAIGGQPQKAHINVANTFFLSLLPLISLKFPP